MLVSSFNLSQSFNYTPHLFYKKRFKSEINSFCIWIHGKLKKFLIQNGTILDQAFKVSTVMDTQRLPNVNETW